MSFYRSLGDIQIASDFGVVAPLQQKVYNLPLPGPHGAGDLLHKLAPRKSRTGCRKWRDRARTQLNSYLFVQTSVHARSQLGGAALKKCEISQRMRVFAGNMGLRR